VLRLRSLPDAGRLAGLLHEFSGVTELELGDAEALDVSAFTAIERLPGLRALSVTVRPLPARASSALLGPCA